MEWFMWIAAQGDWIPIKWVSAWPGGPTSHPRLGVYSSTYGPGQLLNPVQLVLRNLGPGNKRVGGGISRKRWSWGDWRWKLKCMFKGYTLVITFKSVFCCMYGGPSMRSLSRHLGFSFLKPFSFVATHIANGVIWTAAFFSKTVRRRQPRPVNSPVVFVHTRLKVYRRVGLDNPWVRTCACVPANSPSWCKKKKKKTKKQMSVKKSAEVCCSPTWL